MILSIWSSIGDKVVEIAEWIKNFFLEHSRNPFLWVGIIIIVLVMFEYVFKRLNKD